MSSARIAGNRARPGPRSGNAGQTTSEYVSILGIMVATVIACMGLFTAPVAEVFIALFRRMVLYLTGTS
jgi:hypothetical protein